MEIQRVLIYKNFGMKDHVLQEDILDLNLEILLKKKKN